MSAFKTTLVALFLLFGNVAFAADAPIQQDSINQQKATVIRQLLEVTGAVDIGQQFMNRILEVQKQTHPEVDPKVWDRLALKLDMTSMQDVIVEIYDRHFSMQDLQAALAFYKSEPGQRMLKELPGAMNEAMTAGQIWGRQKAEELQKELLDEQAKKQAPGKNA